jgi:acetoin utilization deacetylase AcuC-like enzyme
MAIGFITHHSFMLHNMGDYHPECPERLHAINDRLISAGVEPYLYHREAHKVEREQLLRVHDSDYIDQVFDASPAAGLAYLDGDTAMCPYTLEAALYAAGANVQAVDMVMTGQVKKVFCAVRPPGHHAERHRAMGFCFFNNVAVGAAHAIEVYGLERVAIVDIDVHHGNGTENIYSGNSKVLFCSSFQHPFYPGSGADTNVDNIVNCPLPAGAGSSEFRDAVSQQFIPAIEAFEPQLILISAGFDAHSSDDMAQMELHESDYAWVTQQLCSLADRFSDGRIVSTLEGGYALDALARCVTVHIKALMGEK